VEKKRSPEHHGPEQLTYNFKGPELDIMRSFELSAARYDPGDRVILSGKTPSETWKVTRVYWSDTKGIVYDLECGPTLMIAVPEDQVTILDGWARLL
jgi:hypothetical protein